MVHIKDVATADGSSISVGRDESGNAVVAASFYGSKTLSVGEAMELIDGLTEAVGHEAIAAEQARRDGESASAASDASSGSAANASPAAQG